MSDGWLVGLGWDVGGWMGRKHGAAAVAWRPGETSVRWLGRPSSFRLGRDPLTVELLLKRATDKTDLSTLVRDRLILGVDAPLGYPAAFRSLVVGGVVPLQNCTREIDNTVAYRETERHVHRAFRKKPLSAPFDKLGNNASVAISHVRRWGEESGLKLAPFEDVSDLDDVVIEVYPALAKKNGKAAHPLSSFMPQDAEPGTDEYDAAICALIALAYGARNRIPGLPDVALPSARSVYAEEGWIYYLDDRSSYVQE